MDEIQGSPEAIQVLPLSYAKGSIPMEWSAMVSIVAIVGITVATGRLLMLAGWVVMYARNVIPLSIGKLIYPTVIGASGVSLAVACLLLLLAQRSSAFCLLLWTEFLTFAALLTVTVISLTLEWFSTASPSDTGFQNLSYLLTNGAFSLIVILLGVRIARERRGH